jgi:hypothetical protein
MLTGRAVTARLLAAGDGENVPPLPAGPNLRFARQAVLQGLSDVVNEGTGRAIARAAFARPVRNGDMFRLYAKTGTPAVERNAIERARLQDFADAGCGLRLTTSAGRRSLGVGRNAGDPAASIRAATGGCRRFASSARALANEIALLNRSRDLNSIRSGPGGAVVQIPPRRSEGEGHILVLMVERYRPDTRQTCAVRVVAVNLQARVAQDKTPGIDYVNSLFRNPSTLQWLQGQPCPERRR